jgi:Na+-transporting methylmalonyl-CoA/oxaloacetate decarboxylase gamma subunit
MSISDSILVSLFGISIVFIVLIALSWLIKIQSILFGTIAKKNKKTIKKTEDRQKPMTTENVIEVANGQLSIIDVDEKTAALVMAIVSDELQVPLSELQFKYIKAVD